MILSQSILDDLTARAKASPRRRMNLDLRTTPEDRSQRMLNAIEPESVLPVHRHRTTTDTVAILRGHLQEVFYDDSGEVGKSSISFRAALFRRSASPPGSGIRSVPLSRVRCFWNARTAPGSR